jgi:tRNA pseudouridine38-40 synthase
VALSAESANSSPAGLWSAEYRVQATVAYDGTDFCGFQIQTLHQNAPRTVQGVLEQALLKITGQRTRIVVAGRTDSGVHALGQVIAFNTTWRSRRQPAHSDGPHSDALVDLHRALNAVLPGDVAILSLSQVQPGFHPRFDATSRAYRYTVWNHPVRNPLLRRTALWERRPLDVSSMSAALELLIGEHDFATFGTAPGRKRGPADAGSRAHSHSDGLHSGAHTHDGPLTVRRVLAAKVTCGPMHPMHGLSPYETLCVIDIEANAFLYRMVRSIVGTILQVGRAKLSVEQFASVFASRERGRAGPTAPPHGLCLMAVNYRPVASI